MNGGGSTRTESRSVPWEPQGRELERFFSESGRLYDDGEQQFFPGSTIAGRSNETMLSLDMATELANAFSPRDAANEFIGQVAGGDFMPGAGGNPYLDDVFDTMSRRVTEAFETTTLPGLQTRFAGAGHVGGGSSAFGNASDRANRTLARELGDLGTEVYYGDYERRMGDRFRAAGMAGEAQANEAAAIGLMAGVGQENENLEQRMIDDAIARFNFGQNEPEARLDRYGNRINQNLGFGTTTGRVPSQGGNAGLSAGLGLMSMIATLGGSALLAGPAAPVAAGRSGLTAMGPGMIA